MTVGYKSAPEHLAESAGTLVRIDRLVQGQRSNRNGSLTNKSQAGQMSDCDERKKFSGDSVTFEAACFASPLFPGPNLRHGCLVHSQVNLST